MIEQYIPPDFIVRWWYSEENKNIRSIKSSEEYKKTGMKRTRNRDTR